MFSQCIPTLHAHTYTHTQIHVQPYYYVLTGYSHQNCFSCQARSGARPTASRQQSAEAAAEAGAKEAAGKKAAPVDQGAAQRGDRARCVVCGVCVCMCVYVCVRVCNACVWVLVQVCVCVCVCTSVHVCVNMCICMCVHGIAGRLACVTVLACSVEACFECMHAETCT